MLQYSGSRRQELHGLARAAGKRLWMSEVGFGGYPPEDVRAGLDISRRILDDLNIMKANAWVYWQVEHYRHNPVTQPLSSFNEVPEYKRCVHDHLIGILQEGSQSHSHCMRATRSLLVEVPQSLHQCRPLRTMMGGLGGAYSRYLSRQLSSSDSGSPWSVLLLSSQIHFTISFYIVTL